MTAPSSARAALGAQEPVTWIDAGGTRLAAMCRGRGTPVLCLHAIAHGARDFEALAERVGDRFEIIALDWPGQGLSPSDGKSPTAAHYENVALRAMDALKLDRAVLIGNSIGGAAAIRIAAHRPERVDALVICNPGGLAPVTPFVRFAIGRMTAFFRAGARGARWFGSAYRFYYRRLVLPRARKHAERIIAAGYEMAPVLTQAWEGFALPDADLRPLVETVRCPVFAAWAKSDRLVSWSASRKAVRKFRDLRVQLFRGGHAAFLEDADRFARAFRRFAEEKAAP